MKNTVLNLFRALSLKAQNVPAPQPEKSFVEVFREFNRRDAKENSHAGGTIKKYENFAVNLEKYLASIGWPNLPVSAVKISLLEDFKHWLHENLSRCCKTHSSKHIERCKKVMDYATVIGYVPFNPISSYKSKRDPDKKVINLENKEFKMWVAAKWESKTYQKAQDNYIFQMTAGLSYMDLFTYKTVIDPDTGIWIESERGKGKLKKTYWVPLYHEEFALALAIHEKYQGKLPFLENHFYNRLLREMAAILGIEKHLTSHTGRKTFATLKDQKGWSLGPISAVMGNTEKICRKHYINPSKKKIEAELRRLFPVGECDSMIPLKIGT